jgi:5-methylcytosine-specific restriction enzyme A
MTNATIEQLRPVRNQRVIDLVERTGMDISDWANFAGGADKAASNPKYCYKWSFIEPKKFIVLSLWHEELKESNNSIYQEFNNRSWANDLAKQGKHPAWVRRGRSMDIACQTAWREKLSVRVIFCDGSMRGIGDEQPSEVSARELDETHWAITAYDWHTGDCKVTRGAIANKFADQFSQEPLNIDAPQRHLVLSNQFLRSANVRTSVLQRSMGECEFCSSPGFELPDGRIFLETHHIVPLAENGIDHTSNVIALCPNHHREAHYGKSKSDIKLEFQEILKRKIGST